MNISITNTESTVTIAIDERLDTLTAPELEKVIKENAEKYQAMIVDLSQLEYISSAGLRSLIVGHKLMSKKGGFTIKSPRDNIMDIINLTGLTKFVKIER